MKKDTINFKNNYFQISVLAFFSIIIGSSYPYLQYGIDGGLVLSGIVKYHDLNSPMVYYYLNSWTSIHQFSALLLKIGLSVENVSKILMIITSVFFSFGVFLFFFFINQSEEFISIYCDYFYNFRKKFWRY